MAKYTYKKMDEPNFMRDRGLNLKKISGLEQEFVLRKVIKNFEEKFKNDELAYFHHNIRNLKIRDIEKSLVGKMKLMQGFKKDVFYVPFSNTLYLGNNIDEAHLSHELLRLASSTKYSKFIRFTGFKYTNHFGSLGSGINEGYTELLNDRHLSEEEGKDTIEKRYAKCVEDLIGTYSMMFHYFTGNLKGLLRELRQYFEYDEIIRFIKDLDYIYNACGKEDLSDEEQEKLEKKYKRANEFIAEGFNKKIDNETIGDKRKDQFFEDFCKLSDSAFLVEKLYPNNSKIVPLSKSKKYGE